MSAMVVTLEEFQDFRNRVIKARDQLASIDRGARTRCGDECRLTPSRMSNILSARYYDLDALDRMELWISLTLADQGASQVSGQQEAAAV